MIESLDIDPIIALLESAGELIMSFYNSGDVQVDIKADKSPVTNADKASNDFILERLKELYPGIPVISEETTHIPYELRKGWDYCWMVDPLDGTKEFIKRNGEFSINLALIHMHKPVVGFIHFPVQGWTYYAIKGQGAFKKSSSIKTLYPKNTLARSISHSKPTIRIMISRSHSGQSEHDFAQKIKDIGYQTKTHPHGSAMKHCLIAEGKGDIYPKFGICSEWDTAPGQIILQEAGGKVTQTLTGLEMEYNKPNFENPEFIMWGPDVPKDLLNNLLDS